MKHKLEPEEQLIENEADSFRPVSVEKLRKMEGILDRARKSRTVNIRISENVLEELKRRSEREGIPYQTLISSILYKYVTDRLVDEEAIRRSLQLLQAVAWRTTPSRSRSKRFHWPGVLLKPIRLICLRNM